MIYCRSPAAVIGRGSKGVCLRPLACWDCGFEYRRGHGCSSVVSVVCCQVEVSATSSSLVQRNPTDCAASLRDREFSKKRRPWPTRVCRAAMGGGDGVTDASFVVICVLVYTVFFIVCTVFLLFLLCFCIVCTVFFVFVLCFLLFV